MRCPHCQHKNREGARFCAACGSSLAPKCPACGRQPPPGAAFCDQCGTPVAGSAPTAPSPPVPARPQIPQANTPKHLAEKILTARSALEGERKQVTVLFADVAGFTTLAEQLDPEIVHDLINRCCSNPWRRFTDIPWGGVKEGSIGGTYHMGNDTTSGSPGIKRFPTLGRRFFCRRR
jgi:hypothetical protein